MIFVLLELYGHRIHEFNLFQWSMLVIEHLKIYSQKKEITFSNCLWIFHTYTLVVKRLRDHSSLQNSTLVTYILWFSMNKCSCFLFLVLQINPI